VGTLIDASVLIAIERGDLNLAAARADDDEELAIAAITASELLHGVHRLRGAVARTRAERFVEHLLDAIPVIPFDLDVARIHARIDAELSAAGAAVGDADLMIAATAVWLDYRIATRDLRSFPRIKGLTVARWSA
jgi:predicted nucleic acid-binding protein